MWQVKCDDFVVYDPRDEDLILIHPKCKVGVNMVDSASFTILPTHPYASTLRRLKSKIEFIQNGVTVFRGRMPDDGGDFYKQRTVDLEGALSYTNDSIIEPFEYPAQGETATVSDQNTVELFLRWVIDQHNAQVQEWQRLKVGVVTVTDPNNYITRSSDAYTTTWEILKTKLFDSSLGGYLYPRYEDDGTYIDYVAELPLTNTQHITLGENLLDFSRATSAYETYTVILPVGAEVEREITGEVIEGEYVDFENTYTVKEKLTLIDLPDGDLTDDLVKVGKYIYSKSGVEQYGWRCVPPNESVWDDITLAENLQARATEHLTGALKLTDSISIKAVDLNLTDEEIQAIRACRNVVVDSPIHGLDAYVTAILDLDIDILNPQNTVINIGDTVRTFTDLTAEQGKKIDLARTEMKQYTDTLVNTTNESLRQVIQEQSTAAVATAESIIMQALESYVETGDYDQFKETVEAQLQIMSDTISLNFTSTTEHITDVEGDLQCTMETLSKHFEFTADGLTIRAGDGAMTLSLDNDIISFKKNGEQFGWWDGVNFHTGNIVVNVNERAQFGAFAFIPRSDGSMMFLKVGATNGN